MWNKPHLLNAIADLLMLVAGAAVLAAAAVWLVRVPSLPADTGPGRRVRLALDAIDLLGPEVACRYLCVIEEIPGEPVEEEEAQ